MLAKAISTTVHPLARNISRTLVRFPKVIQPKETSPMTHETVTTVLKAPIGGSLPSVVKNLPLPEAYRFLKIALSSLNEPVIGIKGGFTDLKGSIHPLAGPLFTKNQVAPGSTVLINGPKKVEAELTYTTGKMINSPITIEQLSTVIASVQPGIEMPKARFNDTLEVDPNTPNAAEKKAANLLVSLAHSDQFTIGEPNQYAPLEPYLNDITARLFLQDETGQVKIISGNSADALGDQRKTLVWLINQTLATTGNPIEPGTIIFTGALGGAQIAHEGPVKVGMLINDKEASMDMLQIQLRDQ